MVRDLTNDKRMPTECDQQRHKIFDSVMELLQACGKGDWEDVISAACEIERIAGELKQADEIDKELWRNG